MYFEWFSCRDDLIKEFQLDFEEVKWLDNVLVAGYFQESYEGFAFVLLEKDGELYEVNASHCSCNGLENQWSPELVVPAELYKRMKFGFREFDNVNFRKAIISIILEHLPAEFQNEIIWDLDAYA